MNRIVIGIDGTGNDAGANCLITQKGRVKLVQWNVIAHAANGAFIATTGQLSTQAVFQNPTDTYCQAPTEIAQVTLFGFNVTDATGVAAYNTGMMVPADYALEAQQQLFVNFNTQAGNPQAVNGYVVVFWE